MRKILFVLFVLGLGFSSCSEYQAVLKSKDNEFKYTKAKEYYEGGMYSKAISLLEGLINVYRGTDKAEEVFYLYSNCHYKQRDYIQAGYYFKNFSQTYRNSKYTEECLYLSAYCNYLSSPKTSLDQKDTKEALASFEFFLSKYPNTTRMDDVKRLIKELQTKLEEKTYKSAVLYYDLGYFQSAYVAVKAALQESPSSAFREELMLLDMKARYEYADNSVLGKQAERYEDVIKSYTLFLDVYPQSQYLKVATRLQERAQNALDKLKVAQL